MMLVKIVFSLTLIGAMSVVTAAETSTLSVDAQIEAIQNAPAAERVELMNNFKERIASMNEADRSAAIEQLQATLQPTQTREQIQARVEEHAQEMQMQVNEKVNQMQSMNQTLIGDKMANMPNNPPITVTPAVDTMSGAANNIKFTAPVTQPVVVPVQQQQSPSTPIVPIRR